MSVGGVSGTGGANFNRPPEPSFPMIEQELKPILELLGILYDSQGVTPAEWKDLQSAIGSLQGIRSQFIRSGLGGTKFVKLIDSAISSAKQIPDTQYFSRANYKPIEDAINDFNAMINWLNHPN